MSNCRRGLDDRSRDDDGTIRQKRGDTRVKRLREIYGESFAPDVRSDMKLETLRAREQASLSELIKRYRQQQ
jgi:hypothetical protein